jgi:hypothetical protein
MTDQNAEYVRVPRIYVRCPICGALALQLRHADGLVRREVWRELLQHLSEVHGEQIDSSGAQS